MKTVRHYVDVELRASEKEERTVEGLACVFDTETDLGYFKEKIDRKAFENCDMSDVYLLFNHDENFVLARTLNGSLNLEVRDGGLYQTSKIVETSQGKDIYQLVREGLVNKMSFAFTVDQNDGEEWRTDENGFEHRTIKKVNKLYDVSLVTYPAYPTTEAFARNSSDLDDLARKHLEERGIVLEEMKEIQEQEEVKEEVLPEEEPVSEPVSLEEQEPEKEEEVPEVPTSEEVEEVPEMEEKKEEEERNMNTNFEVRSNEEVAYNSTPEYRSAWIKAVIGKGDEDLNAIKEARGLTTASATLVPTYIADKIQRAWEKNILLNEVAIVYSAAKLSFPVETANSGAGYHVEGAEAPAEETITLVDKLLQPMTVKKWISVTTELIDSGEIAIMDYIAEEVAYHILKFISNAIVNGTLQSGKGIEGIVNSSLADAVNAGALDGTTFYKGLASLIDVDSPVVVMNPTDFYTKVMGLLDTTGRPIYSALGAEQYVAGCKVLLNSAVPANKAIVGDLKAFQLELEAREPRMVFDPYTSAREDKVNVVGRLMAAGAVVKPHQLAVVTFTA